MTLLIRVVLTSLIVFFYLNTSSQFYTAAQISTIDSAKSAFEGDLYLDTINNSYFIGLSNGKLSEIGMDSVRVSSIIDDYMDTLGATIFPIWAERSSALANNSFQWAYGNGDASQASFGIIIPVDCELFAVGLTCFTGSAEVEVYKNGAATTLRSGTASPNAINTGITPLEFSNGDIINFRTVTASGASSGGKAVAWFRVRSKPNYDRIYGGSIPSPSLGSENDEYLNTSNGDLYVKENGIWVLKMNLKGITGASSLRSYIQVSNTLSTNINNGTTAFSWMDTVSSTHITNDSANFSVDTDGIIINKTATYKVTIYQYQNSTAERPNAVIRLTKDGTLQPGFGANAYMRSFSGHNESTASFSKIISVTAGEKIGFVNIRQAQSGTVTCPANSLVFIIEEM